MPAPLRFDDIAAPVVGAPDSPTAFESIPAPVQQPDVPTDQSIPLARRPVFDRPESEGLARARDQVNDNTRAAAETLWPEGKTSDVDKLESILWDSGVGAEGMEKQLAQYKLAKQTGLPLATIQADFPRIEEAWKAASSARAVPLAGPGQLPLQQPYKRPGQRFLEEQPELAKALLRDPLAGFVSKAPEVGALTKGWRAAADFAFDAPVVGAHSMMPDDVAEEIRKDREKQRAQADQPQLVLQDEQSKQMQDGWVDVPTNIGGFVVPIPIPKRAIVPFLRAQESWASLNTAKAYDELANLETLGRDTTQKELEILDLEQKATRRDYGEGAIEQVFTDAAEGTVSTASAFTTVAEEPLETAIVSVPVGVGVALVTKSPGAGAAATLKMGAGYGMWHLERGGAYQQMLAATKPDGSPAMDRQTARVASAIYATLAAPIETMSWGPMLNAMGPIGALIKEGEKKAFTEALIKNPGFMATVRRLAKEALVSGLTEGGEEFLQDATQQAVEFFARAHGNGRVIGGYQDLVEGYGSRFDNLAPPSLEQSIVAWGKGAPGGIGMTIASENVNLATQYLFRDKAVVDSNKLRELTNLAKSPVAANAPKVLADMFEEHTATTGEAVKTVYVTAKEFTRLFQDEGADPDGGARSLLGPTGPQQLADAVASNGRLAVPVTDYIEKWVPSEAAKRLLQHTATSELGLTAAEAKALPLDQMAEEIAAKVLGADEQTAATQFDRLEEQIVASGKATPKEARIWTAPMRALVRTAAAATGVPAQKLFEKYSVTFGAGDEALTVALGAPADSRYLTRTWHALKPEQQLRALYIDTTTGALNRRAFDRVKPAGRLFASIKVEGIKYRNDLAGHAAGNVVYRQAAQALAGALDEVYKPGGDFGSFVESDEQLQAALARANEHPGLKGFKLSGAVGKTYRAATAESNKRSAELEAKGQRAQRGLKPLQASGELDAGVDVLRNTKLNEQLRAAAATLKPADMFDETFVDHETGLLNKDGYDAAPQRAFTLSGDLDGVKEMNGLFGEDATDKIIAAAGNAMRELEAHRASMAHISGDEFQGKHDSQDTLNAYGRHLQQQLERVEVDLELTEAQQQKTGLPAKMTLRGLPFSFGVGKTLDDADRALQANKAQRSEAGLRGEGKVRERVVPRAEAAAAAEPARAAQGDRGARAGGPGAVRLGGRSLAGPEVGRQRFFDAGRLEQDRARAEAVKPAQRLEAPADKGVPRGYTDVLREGMEKIFRIALNPNSDLSTFHHETGHVFLELLADLAELPGKEAARYKDMFASTLKWLGVEKREQIQREQHEKFARGYEAYLFEGKSPSAALARAFERMKLWVRSVYRDVRNLNVELNEEVRSVYDRLLATDDELHRQARRQGTLSPMAQDLMGMTDAEYLSYKDAEIERLSAASLRADHQVFKERLRENEAWWKEEHKKELELARDQYEQLRARRVQLYLRGKSADSATAIALDRRQVERALGPELARKFQLRKTGGENIDDIAAAYDYPTGQAMLEDVLQLPEKDKWARAEATQQMAEKHPGVLDDRVRLAELIGQGLHGEMTQRWLVREWIALKRKVTVPGQPMWTPESAPIETLKLAAQRIVERTRLSALSPGPVLAAERKAADLALKHAAKGEYGVAFINKQEQLLNMFRWRYITEARQAREKFLELAGSLAKDVSPTAKESRLGKASPIYRDFTAALLEALQLKEPGEQGANVPSIGDLVTQLDADAMTVGFDEGAINQIMLAQGQSYKDLTVAELRHVDALLRTVKAAATGKNSALFGEKRMDLEELEQKLLHDSEVHGSPPAPPIPSSESGRNGWQRFRGWIVSLDGSLLRPEQMIRMYMGDSWVKALVDPLQKAKHGELALLKEVVKPVVDAMEAIPRAVRNRMDEEIDGKKLFPGHRVAFDQNVLAPTKRHELLVMALNMGNESNISRLTIGRSITLEQVNAALELLTKEELDWVQSVWDASEKMWPLAAELEERDSGLAPQKLERRPLVTKHGTYSGGYFPAVYDWRVEQAGERQQASTLAGIIDPRYVRPGTAQSHLKGRVDGFTGAIALEASTVKRALFQVAHDIAYREAVKSVGTLLLRPQLRAEMNNRMGYERSEQLLQWLKDSAQQRGLEGAVKTDAIIKALKHLRAGKAIAVLGYSATTFLGDLANVATAIPRSGLQIKHWAAGLSEFLTSPQKSMQEALSKSGELSSRRQSLIRKLEHQVRDLSKSGFWALRGMRWITDHSFAFLEASDAITAAPVWMGAYRQALANEMTEADAVKFADSMLRDNFPGESPVDLPAVLRDKAWVGQSIMFYRYFSVVYNSLRDMVQPLATAEDPAEFARRVPRAAGRMLAFGTIALVLSELLSGRGPEDDEDWGSWYARKLIFGGLSSVPLLGEAGAAIEQLVLHKSTNARGNLFAQLIADLAKGVVTLKSDDADAEKKLKAIMQTFAPLLHLPATQPLRTGLGIAGQLGDDPARNPLELGSDVTYGRREGQPENPLSIAGEAIAGSPR